MRARWASGACRHSKSTSPLEPTPTQSLMQLTDTPALRSIRKIAIGLLEILGKPSAQAQRYVLALTLAKALAKDLSAVLRRTKDSDARSLYLTHTLYLVWLAANGVSTFLVSVTPHSPDFFVSYRTV
jgi:hypothetical protein